MCIWGSGRFRKSEELQKYPYILIAFNNIKSHDSIGGMFIVQCLVLLLLDTQAEHS